MQPIYLLELASHKATWLAAREAAVAGNIANANTPGYRAKDVASFSDVLAKTQLEMASTGPSHLSPAGTGVPGATAAVEDDNAVDVTETGNSVGIENELIKAGDVNRDYALTTSVVKTFHAMLMASLRGSG